jgi:hypothetical protein
MPNLYNSQFLIMGQLIRKRLATKNVSPTSLLIPGKMMMKAARSVAKAMYRVMAWISWRVRVKIS